MNRLGTVLAVAGALAVGAWLLWPKEGADGPAAPAVPLTVVDPATAGSVQGVIRFEGAPPSPAFIDMSSKSECHGLHADRVSDGKLLVKGGKLQNALVYVKSGLEKAVFAVPTDAVVIDQKACLFSPRVTALRTGQPLEFVNSDPTQHNVKTAPDPKYSKGFNLNLARKGSRGQARLSKAEVAVRLSCDYHGWMEAWVAALDHPFFQVTGEDGTYSLKGLPPGDYEIAVWHETLGERSAKVHLDATQREVTADFAFPAKP